MNLDSVKASSARRRTKFETIFAAGWLLFGLLVLPALVYWVGVGLLGPYTGTAGLTGFLGDFTKDLVAGSGRAWILLTAPYVTILVLRALLFGIRPSRRQTAEEKPEPAH